MKNLDKRLLLPIGIGVVALLAVAAAVVFAITGNMSKAALTAKIVAQNETITTLQSDLDSMSETITVFRAKTDIKSGNTVKDDDLEQIQVSTMFCADYDTTAEDIVGNIAIADIAKGSYITKDFVYPVELKSDHRTLDVICDRNPIGFNIGDTIDVRITFPNGQDFVLLSKKLVNDVYGNVVQIVVDEKDILIYKSAEADWARFTKNGTPGQAVQIYCTTYVAAGAQNASTQYYPIQTKLPDGQTFEGSTYWIALNDYNLNESDLSNWLSVDRDKLERALRDYDWYWVDQVTYDATYRYTAETSLVTGNMENSVEKWFTENATITILDTPDRSDWETATTTYSDQNNIDLAVSNAFGARALKQDEHSIVTMSEISRYKVLDTVGGSAAVNDAKVIRDLAHTLAAQAYSERQLTLTKVQEHEKEVAEENLETWEPWSDAEVLEWTKRYIDGMDIESYQIQLEEQKKQEEEEALEQGTTIVLETDDE